MVASISHTSRRPEQPQGPVQLPQTAQAQANEATARVAPSLTRRASTAVSLGGLSASVHIANALVAPALSHAVLGAVLLSGVPVLGPIAAVVAVQTVGYTAVLPLITGLALASFALIGANWLLGTTASSGLPGALLGGLVGALAIYTAGAALPARLALHTACQLGWFKPVVIAYTALLGAN